MNSFDLEALFASFQNIKIGVIGDAMLDTYWFGKVERISPEAPVPIVSVEKKEQRIGGAGNVALNLSALKSKVHLISVIGCDAEGEQLEKLLQNNNIHTEYIIKDQNRPTTNKIRIIGRQQQMMRLDAELSHDLSEYLEEHFLSIFKNYIEQEQPQLVLMEDYNKGVLTKKNIQQIISICKQHDVLIAVDPKKNNFFEYKGVDIFKPNLHEATTALQMSNQSFSVDMLHDIHQSLHNQLHHQISFITLSEKGVYYNDNQNEKHISTHVRTINDVSGAGDTVIAVASLVYAATKDVHLMAELANIAGGLVCEEVGTVAINREQLLSECKKVNVN